MKNILITGGSGSFGNAFVRRLLATEGVERIVVYSRDEQKQEAMAREIGLGDSGQRVRFFLGDVRDCDRLTFALHGIDTVVHAAALKIVPAAEYNPTECVATNITGAENVVKACIRSGVKRAIALSTDKAVNPVNLYGATKLAMEKIFIAANALSAGGTKFSVVRYGNVVGSRGSVVPLFKRLALEGKALPITDKRMTRFWITLDHAIDLVLICYREMRGREIFVPQIPSMFVIDLARAISGNDFWLETGIRPGEKIHEVLITEDEARHTLTGHGWYKITPGGQTDVPDGFRYASDTNDEWLTVDQLKDMIK